MAHRQIWLLGPMHVMRDGQPVTCFGYTKVQALLAYLLVEAHQLHQRAQLAEIFWPEQPPGIARTSLRQALAHLRRAIDAPGTQTPLLTATRTTVQLNPAADYWLDLAAFDELLLACRQAGGGAAPDDQVLMQRLQQAGALYRDDFLAGFPLIDCPAFDQWVYTHQVALRTRMLQALGRLAAIYERQGDLDRAIRVARRQLAIEAWHEAAHRTLMRLLARTGDRDAALAQFEQCRLTLHGQLDLPPGAETLALYTQIKTSAAPPLAVPMPARSPRRPSRLAAQPDPLIGREHELQLVKRLVLDPSHRMVTITGPGGIGKTRLALAAAHDLADQFAHGVYLVRLAEGQHEAMLAATIADALSLQLEGQADTTTQLLSFLADRQILLLLDNAEYALDGLGILVRILEMAPYVTLLATSHERLRLRWEWQIALTGLALPEPLANGAPGAAVELFHHCARRVAPEFRLHPTNYPAVVRICQLLEGVPLGIELAASGLATADCATIAQQLGVSLTRLRTDLRDLPPRHLSLWNVCAHSWQRLHAQEQVGLRRLAVFRGGFTLAAARAVATITDAVLARLADQSLLYQDQSGRYGMHEFIRQFAAEQLVSSGEETAIRDRHLDYSIGLAEQHDAALSRGPQDRQLAALFDLTIETANWRSALSWAEASARRWPQGMRLVAALTWYWHYHGDYAVTRQIGERWLAHAEAAGAPDAYSGVCQAIGHIAYAQGDYAAARALFAQAHRALQHAGPSRRRGHIASCLGLAYLLQGDLAAAHAYVDEAWTIFEAIADPDGLSHTQYVLGRIYQAEGADARACACLEASLAHNLRQQNIFAILALVASLGTIKCRTGQAAAAERLLGESMAHIRTYCASRAGVFLPDAVERLASLLQSSGWTVAAAALREMVASKGS